MLLKEIKAILGGDVSTKNTKMPGTSFGPRNSGLPVLVGVFCRGRIGHKL